jgi:hypothetical protein
MTSQEKLENNLRQMQTKTQFTQTLEYNESQRHTGRRHVKMRHWSWVA